MGLILFQLLDVCSTLLGFLVITSVNVVFSKPMFVRTGLPTKDKTSETIV